MILLGAFEPIDLGAAAVEVWSQPESSFQGRVAAVIKPRTELQVSGSRGGQSGLVYRRSLIVGQSSKPDRMYGSNRNNSHPDGTRA